jgi:succinoglycan biosynthesis transport protein ExoP
MNSAPEVAITASQGPYGPRTPIRREMTIGDVLAILSRRAGILCGTIICMMAIGVLLCVNATRLYKATAEVQVQRETADALGLDNMIDQSSSGPDAMDSNITLQTEASVLQSDSLALRVIKALGLENTADFRPHFNLIGWVMGLFSPTGPHDPSDLPLEEVPGRRSRAVGIFESHLKVKPVPGTRLISIEYFSRDPHTAAIVLNLLIRNLMEFNFETRHGATQQAAQWLSIQLSDLRKQSEDLQAKVVELQRGSGLFSLGQTDSQGHEQLYTPALEKLQLATTQLQDAQAARIMKGALYQVVKDGDPELISGLAGNSTLAGSSPGISGSLSLLQSLRAQEAQTQAQLDELSAKFGSDYPKLVEMRASLKGTQNAIAAESERVAARVRNDYAIAVQVEARDRDVFEEEKKQAESLNDKAVEYDIVRQEATQSRDLYESLLSRLKEADLVAGLHSSNITVVDPARVPARPAKPNIPIYMAGSLALGLILGACAALLRDATDNSILDIDDVGSLDQQIPIGLLPYHAGLKGRLQTTRKSSSPQSISSPTENALYRKDSIVAAAEPRAAYTEALRALRTSLMQRSYGGQVPQVVLVTSSVPGEGKSMLSINLATVYAQHGKKVLLVDADLRTPTLQDRLCLTCEQGLSDLLSRPQDDMHPLQPLRFSLDGDHVLDIVLGGAVPDYPAELLGSTRMAEAIGQWRRDYDHIFLDGAPLLPVTDSALLSACSDFTLIVARHKMTDRRSLEKTLQILRTQGVRNTGVVLNAVRAHGGAQYKYYGYRPLKYSRSKHVA